MSIEVRRQSISPITEIIITDNDFDQARFEPGGDDATHEYIHVSSDSPVGAYLKPSEVPQLIEALIEMAEQLS